MGKSHDLSSGNMGEKVSWLLTSTKENKFNVGSSGKPEGFANSASSPTAAPLQQPVGSSFFPFSDASAVGFVTPVPFPSPARRGKESASHEVKNKLMLKFTPSGQ